MPPLHPFWCYTIKSAKLNSLITAAGIKAKPIYCQIFAEILKGIDLSALIEKMTVASGPAAPAAGAATATPAEGASKKEEEKKEEAKDESSESDLAFGTY